MVEMAEKQIDRILDKYSIEHIGCFGDNISEINKFIEDDIYRQLSK